MAIGQVINYYIPIQMSGNEIKNFVIEVLPGNPSEPKVGQIWFNSIAGTLYMCPEVGVNRAIATGNSLETAVKTSEEDIATVAGAMIISGGLDKSAVSYIPDSAGIVKVSDNGVVSIAVVGDDFTGEDEEGIFTNKTIDAADNTISNISVGEFTADTGVTTTIDDSTDDDAIPTALAVYNLVGSIGSLVSDWDASAGLPTEGSGAGGSIAKGDYWMCSVAGSVTGLYPEGVEPGDIIVATIDDADTGAEFFVLQGNLNDVILSTGDASVVNALPVYDSENGKLLAPTNVVVGEDGSLNIPAGETYNIDGEAHNHNFNDLTDTQGQQTVNDLLNKNNVS